VTPCPAAGPLLPLLLSLLLSLLLLLLLLLMCPAGVLMSCRTRGRRVQMSGPRGRKSRPTWTNT
jgi:hypothetical protein